VKEITNREIKSSNKLKENWTEDYKLTLLKKEKGKRKQEKRRRRRKKEKGRQRIETISEEKIIDYIFARNSRGVNSIEETKPMKANVAKRKLFQQDTIRHKRK